LGSNTTPIFALLICFLLAVIGLIAAEYQRRSVRR
jgi:cell division protein FtsL